VKPADLWHPTFNSPWVAKHQVPVAWACALAFFAIGCWLISNGVEINRTWGWGSL